MKIIDLETIKKQDFEKKVEYFKELYSYITENLRDEQIEGFQEEFNKIDPNKLIPRIQYLTSWVETTKINISSNGRFAFIKLNFPEQYDLINQQYLEEFETERPFWLQRKIIELVNILENKEKAEISRILMEAKKNMNDDDYLLTLDKIQKTGNVSRQLRILKKEIKKITT